MIKKKKKTYEEDYLYESNDIFACITGYTSNGFPYGITWEEMDELEQQENRNQKFDEEEIDEDFILF